MPEKEDGGTGEGGAGPSGCVRAAAPPPLLPVLSAEVLSSLEQQLKQNLHMLFFDASPKAKASANSWLLQFQQSPEAWPVSRHVLEHQLLGTYDAVSASAASTSDVGGGEQLVMVAAQTLAWKIIQQGHCLKAEEKKQLACFLLQLVASVHSQPLEQKQVSLSRLSVAVLSRLAECIAQCIVQTGGEQSVWPSALPDLMSFARVPSAPIEGPESSGVEVSCHHSCLFSLPCCLAVAVLTAIPDVLKGLDAPSRGVRRVVETRQALAVERHWEPVMDLVSDLLLARSQNPRSAHTPACSVSASACGISACAGGGTEKSTGCECLRFQSLCVEGSLHLLIGWMGLWDTRPFLQHVRLCRALAAAVPQLAEQPALTDCLVAALPKLSTYMQLWSLSGPPAHQQHPRSSSCSSRSRPLGDSPLPPGTSTAEPSGVCAGSGVCAPDASQQQLLCAWSEGGLPSTGGEGELCGAVVRQLIEVSRLLSGRDRSTELSSDEDSGEMLALLLRWGAVLQTLLEGFPGLLLDDFGIDRGGSFLAAGGSVFENQSVCGTLLVQLWSRQPQTWLCASNIWGVVKELRRDQLLPVPLLQLLLQRLAPSCISSMLRHCRRDSFAWGLGADASSLSSSVSELAEERELFIDTAGDVVCDVFFLYDACGGDEGRAFLQSLGEGMQAALRQRDAAGAEVLLLLSDALVEGLNGIPLPLAPLFLCLPALPEGDAACATAAAKILKKAAIHFTEEDPEYAGLSAPPTATCSAALLTQIWTVALQTLLRLLPLDPPLVADSVLQLATWGGHHLGATENAEGAGGGAVSTDGSMMACGGEGQQSSATGGTPDQQLSSPTLSGGGAAGGGGGGSLAAALQQLELFCKFVEETGSNYSAQVDGTLHAAAVKLVLTFPRAEIPRLFNGSMRGTRQLLRRCCEGLGTKAAPSDTQAGGNDIIAAAWRGDAARAIQRLELCCSALCGGRVCTSRSSGGCPASSCTVVGTNGGGDEDDSRLASAALECFFLEDGLWLLWLRVLRGVLLLQHHSLGPCDSNGMSSPSTLTLPVNAVTRQRVHLGALVVDLKGKEPLEPPQLNDAVLCVSGLRCMRVLLRGLGPDFLAATQVWAAVADFIGNELVSSARSLADQAATCLADGAGTGSRPGCLCAQATLQACGVVVLGDLLRIATGGVRGWAAGDSDEGQETESVGKLQRRTELLHALKGWAAQRVGQITALFVELGRLLTPQQGMFDIYAPFLDFLLAYAAAAPGVQALCGSVRGGGTIGKCGRRGNGEPGSVAASSGAAALVTQSGESLGPSDLFCQEEVFEMTLRLCVETVRQCKDADVARQALLYYHACSTCGAPQVDAMVARRLPEVVAATLDNLHCWGLENLSVLWKAFALWSERYDKVFLQTISDWLGTRETGVTYEKEQLGRCSAVGVSSRLRDMEVGQKEIVFCCFRSFRGARVRQLLQDLCLIASGSIVPSDALVAYEYALQTDQSKQAARFGSGQALGSNVVEIG